MEMMSFSSPVGDADVTLLTYYTYPFEKATWWFPFATMAFRLLMLISLLNSGFSAETPLFVQTGDSVQLDIQTHELPEFDELCWIKDKLENIVKFLHASKTVRSHSSYKNRVDFNNKTFSLTLKNMQKTDSGLYRARTSGESNNNIVTYRVSVIDAVEAPVLTLNSSWSSRDPCSFTCKGSNIIISSIYNSSSCSPEEVTSSDNFTLRLNCSDDYIMCNHSNPVSFKTEIKKVNELCTVAKEMLKADVPQSLDPLWFILPICLLATSSLASVIGWSLYKRKKDRSFTLEQQDESTIYEKVGENINPKKPLEVLEKSKNPPTVYDTVGEHGTADVTVETNQTSPDQDSSATLTEKSQPDAQITIYSTIQKQPKPETDQTIYDEVNKPPAGDESVHPKPE